MTALLMWMAQVPCAVFLLFFSFSVEPGPYISTGERHHGIYRTCDCNEIWSGHHHR